MYIHTYKHVNTYKIHTLCMYVYVYVSRLIKDGRIGLGHESYATSF